MKTAVPVCPGSQAAQVLPGRVLRDQGQAVTGLPQAVPADLWKPDAQTVRADIEGSEVLYTGL